MTRAAAAALAGVVLVLSGCSDGGTGAVGPATACPLLAELAQTGETVAKADVGDPAKFDAALRSAVADYVRTARRLRAAVPERLRGDVERLVAAAQQYRFEDAITARADIDEYERSECPPRDSE